MRGQTYRCQPARLSTSRLPDPEVPPSLNYAELRSGIPTNSATKNCRTSAASIASPTLLQSTVTSRGSHGMDCLGLAEAGDLRTTHGNADEPGFGGPEEVTWGAPGSSAGLECSGASH